MDDTLYSIRMRASQAGRHVSGAERIVGEGEVEHVAGLLVNRAMSHERGRPDNVTLSLDLLAVADIVRLAALPVIMLEADGHGAGRSIAVRELISAGVTETAASAALNMITSGASPSGGNMRGAMVVDAQTGERLEPDRVCGIRARAVDYDPEFTGELEGVLCSHGLAGTHFREAAALATKVSCAPGIVAELCISDDPSYVTGYVASPCGGYVRITPMKPAGDRMGGRAFFVDPARFDTDTFTRYLRETPVLVTGPLTIR